jgi:hypothetical protein
MRIRLHGGRVCKTIEGALGARAWALPAMMARAHSFLVARGASGFFVDYLRIYLRLWYSSNRRAYVWILSSLS